MGRLWWEGRLGLIGQIKVCRWALKFGKATVVIIVYFPIIKTHNILFVMHYFVTEFWQVKLFSYGTHVPYVRVPGCFEYNMVQYIRHDGSSSLLLSGDLRIFIWMVKGQVLQRLLVIVVIGNLCKNRPQNRDYEIWTRAGKIISPDFFFLFRIDLS